MTTDFPSGSSHVGQGRGEAAGMGCGLRETTLLRLIRSRGKGWGPLSEGDSCWNNVS